MTKTSYVLSFTAGGLLFHESIVLAEELVRADFDWDVALNAVKAENLLQSRTQSTAARKLREVRKRLRLLTVDQLSLVAEGSRLEQKLTLWLACCRRYQLLADFARDVVRSKYEQLDLQLASRNVQPRQTGHPRFFRTQAPTILTPQANELDVKLDELRL